MVTENKLYHYRMLHTASTKPSLSDSDKNGLGAGVHLFNEPFSMVLSYG
ncbi:Uncharacterised protein [Klebsiella pneumoniae]|nr:Uncharacterised protein [Klebsiella pneumoniae]